MTTGEAIARTNEILNGSDRQDAYNYFTTQQPAFFREAVRSCNLDWKEPYTEAQCQAIAAMVVANLKGADDEVARDYAMTAKTTRDERVILNDLISDVNEATGGRVDRPVAYDTCADLGVTIYTERWHGRRDGDNFILPADRQRTYDALAKWANQYKDD